MAEEKYIDFGVAPYALPTVCEALFNNGVRNAFLTMEDGDIHVRWKYNMGRKYVTLTKERDTECNDSL